MAGPRPLFHRLKGVDFYKKIPSDLTETTLTGAIISVTAAFFILLLLGLELSAYVRTEAKSELVVDRSEPGEFLRINFDITFPQMSCEFATVDLNDDLGLKRFNLTKTVHKFAVDTNLDRVGSGKEATSRPKPRYDRQTPELQYETVNVSEPLTQETFEMTLHAYDVVVVNFFAPWCHWCRLLGPTWEAATQAVHAKYPDTEGRIRYAKVDCTAAGQLCRNHYITAFPSMRIFHKGSDEIMRGMQHVHDAYYGDRTLEALVELADRIVPAARGLPSNVRSLSTVESVHKSAGCNLEGYVLVRKVPGTLVFSAQAPGHSFDYISMNLSHRVNRLFFGLLPSPRRLKALAALHPAGLTPNWSDKLAGDTFVTNSPGATFEHYLQVVLTSIEGGRRTGTYDAYEYTAQNEQYDSDDHASVKITYVPSPIQILVTEVRKPLFRFIISLCAVIGGVFTVAGIIDGITHSIHAMAKKVELGKQG